MTRQRKPGPPPLTPSLRQPASQPASQSFAPQCHPGRRARDLWTHSNRVESTWSTPRPPPPRLWDALHSSSRAWAHYDNDAAATQLHRTQDWGRASYMHGVHYYTWWSQHGTACILLTLTWELYHVQLLVPTAKSAGFAAAAARHRGDNQIKGNKIVAVLYMCS